MILCMGEQVSFSDDQFFLSETGRRIHKVKLLHYADNGDLVNPEDLPQIPGIETLMRPIDAERFLKRFSSENHNGLGGEVHNE